MSLDVIETKVNIHLAALCAEQLDLSHTGNPLDRLLNLGVEQVVRIPQIDLRMKTGR